VKEKILIQRIEPLTVDQKSLTWMEFAGFGAVPIRVLTREELEALYAPDEPPSVNYR
jgi:hypothetical protein